MQLALTTHSSSRYTLNEWIKKKWYIYIMKYITELLKNDTVGCAEDTKEPTCGRNHYNVQECGEEMGEKEKQKGLRAMK